MCYNDIVIKNYKLSFFVNKNIFLKILQLFVELRRINYGNGKIYIYFQQHFGLFPIQYSKLPQPLRTYLQNRSVLVHIFTQDKLSKTFRQHLQNDSANPSKTTLFIFLMPAIVFVKFGLCGGACSCCAARK